MGIIYLLHFDKPYHHARHYLGFTGKRSLKSRLERHQAGDGARLMEVVIGAGITFVVARKWKGGRSDERRLKRQHNGCKLCPICRAMRKRLAGQ